jgi:hypothetical protein
MITPEAMAILLQSGRAFAIGPDGSVNVFIGDGRARAKNRRYYLKTTPKAAPKPYDKELEDLAAKQAAEKLLAQTEDKMFRGEMSKRKGKKIDDLHSEEFLTRLETNVAYRKTDIRAELGKFEAFCAEHHQKPKRARFLAWLKRVTANRSHLVGKEQETKFLPNDRV